jgi:uncharacterized membrane protein YhaH (DUF805 family)
MEPPPIHAADAPFAAARLAGPLSVEELAAVALGRGGDALSLRQMYVEVNGRISRRMFWLHGVGTLLVAGVILNALMDIAGLEADVGGKLVNLILAWPYIAVSAKRLHDYNRSAWWMLVNLVPVVGSFVTLLANGCMRGRRGPNRFGPDPKAMRAQRTPGAIAALPLRQ